LSIPQSHALFVQPRSIASIAPLALRRTNKSLLPASFQRRFASDDVAKPEDFAQTAAEPPAEDGLTPAQPEAEADPTNAEATVTPDALEKVAPTANTQGYMSYPAPKVNQTLYIGNLYYEVTDEQLQRVFSRFGEVASARIVFDNRGLSRGFGYVEFKNKEDAQAALDNLHQQVFEGRNLVVQFHVPKSSNTGGASFKRPFSTSFNKPNEPSKTLFICNMSFEMSDKDLNDLFRDIRNVTDVRVAIDRRTGQPRGFAHADFIDAASATQAKEALDGKTIYGRPLRIDFSQSVQSRPKRNDSTQDLGQDST